MGLTDVALVDKDYRSPETIIAFSINWPCAMKRLVVAALFNASCCIVQNHRMLVAFSFAAQFFVRGHWENMKLLKNDKMELT